jgi:glyoxylase-like metal-dependent hydrolase (beta-lactamase superfamily II)
LSDLRKSSPWEVIAVRYGTRMTTKSAVYLNYAQYGEPDAPLRMDYFFWILRNAQEVIIIDTGFSDAAGRRRQRMMTMAPAQALAQLGIDPAAVKRLILTHAHWDHTGNIDLFPNAQILMSRTEFAFIGSDLARRPLLANVLDEDDNRFILQLAAQGRLTLLDPEDRSIEGVLLRELPGHAPGQLAVIVERPGGDVILSSDVTHYYEELARDRPFNVVTDLVAMYRSLEILRGLAAQPGAVVVPGHDPEVMQRFPAIGDFAVRVV